jgi:predicted outer membrane repeat protein
MINKNRKTKKIRLLIIGLGFIATTLFCNHAMLYAQVGNLKDSTGVVFYQYWNYNGGAGQPLAAGSYTLSELAARGVPGDWASSVSIPSGWTVTMYEQDNFNGTSWTLASSTSIFWMLAPNANNQMSSCIIESSDGGSADNDDSDTDSNTDYDPGFSICDEPEPWAVPAVRQVVGNGSAQSCTEDAVRAAARAGGFITFNCGSAPVVISIHSGIQTGSQTVIDGGSADITLNGGGTSQIFIAPSNSSLSVRNLRFINGKAPQSEEADGIGGAVAGQWRSKLEVRNCTFENNTAGRGGGAVGVWTGSSLTIVGSEFTGNRSYYGGAVYSLLSPLQIVNSTFDNNDTINNGWGEGGAIATDGASESPGDGIGGTVELCGLQIRNNHALRSGGGVYIWVYPPDRVVIDRTTVEYNEIGGSGLGGGMRVSNGAIEIKASSFLSNESDNHGGALYLDCEPSCEIVNTTFYGNEAGSYGGAISSADVVNINNVTFANNSAGGHGGALFGGNKFNVHNSIFVDNTAGNPWNQANNCGETGTGDHVLQWHSATNDGGGDWCVSNVIIADPLLAPDPEENGGPTPTLLPDANSPALQAGTGCEPVDQRGEQRDVNRCDLGAVELR